FEPKREKENCQLYKTVDIRPQPQKQRNKIESKETKLNCTRKQVHIRNGRRDGQRVARKFRWYRLLVAHDDQSGRGVVSSHLPLHTDSRAVDVSEFIPTFTRFGCCEFSVGSSAARTHDDNDLGKVAEQRRLRQKRRDFWTANPFFIFPNNKLGGFILKEELNCGQPGSDFMRSANWDSNIDSWGKHGKVFTGGGRGPSGRRGVVTWTIKIAVLPIAKVFTVCSLGLLMASKYVNIFPASGRKLLNGLVFSLLLPCLIFSQLGQAITLQKMLEWWFIPVNVVLGSTSGSIIGYIVASIVRPPYPFFKFTIVQIGIGNIGNVPLVLISALCRDKSNPFGDSTTCKTDGTAYISFGQWVGAIIYTHMYFICWPPPPEGTFDIEEGELPIKNPRNGKIPDQVPLLTHDENEEQHMKKRLQKLTQMIFCFTSVLLYVWLSLILAMVLGSIPFLKKIIFTADGPLFFFTDSCIILGEAMIPCILLALGGNLVDGPGSSKLGLRTTVAIIIGRLVLVPPVGLGIVMLADKLGFLPAGDKMFRFVLLLQHTMPTSVLAGAVANLRGCGREAAAVLFWVHIFAIFSMAGWIVLYLNILF
ncbi:Auxin efflux carrier family protein, partial [Prunus dulcis]